MSKNYGDKIMKKLVISVLLAVLFILSAGVVNAEEKKAGDKKLVPTRGVDPEKRFGGFRRSGQQRDRYNRRGRTTEVRNRLQNVDKSIRIQQSRHKKFIDELVSIKKLAIKEDAKKTAKRIESLIKARNAEFAESTRKLNESRDRFREGLVRPGSKPVTRRRPASVTTPQPEQETKEDKGRWWQFWK
jgi:hypothetical protein